METGQISRAALGNIATLGNLYDARADKFCGLSIFKKTIPSDALTTTDANFSDIQLIYSDDFSEKFNKLDVKAELQVSVLAGLFTLEGSGHYLQDTKKSARTVKSSLLYNIKTKDESVNIYHEDLREAFAIDAIESGVATHVVVGISWGANSVLSCQYENRENRDVKEIEGSLSATLKKMSLSISGKASVDYSDGDNSKGSNFDIRIYGDILPNKEDLPTTMEGALNLMKQLPSLVAQCNGGRGKPLTYRLIPITLLQDYLKFAIKADITLKTLEEASLVRVVKLFDEMSRAQQRLHDFHQDCLEYRYCVPNENLVKISSLKEEMTIQETTLRSKLAFCLVQVRSGKCEVSEVEDLIKEFQNSEFSPQKISTLLDTWGEVIEKINFARTIVQNGGIYIGFGVNLDDEILKDFDSKTFVLYFTKNSKLIEPQTWAKNRQIFIQELKKKSEGCKMYSVDCDIHPGLLPKSKTSCIQVVQSGNVISEDLLQDQEKDGNTSFIQPIAASATKRCVHKPNKRVPLSIPCTGNNCNPQEVHDWICKKCSTHVEWGFDEHVYCHCGKTLVTMMEFKCSDSKHGVAYEKHEDYYLKDLVAKLQPFEEMNILILGETGVGKSTWINAFVNFLHHSTLNEAENADLVTLIPSKFTMTDEDFEEITVETGNDKNEVLEAGKSATQEARIYPFQVGNTTVRLIDTPGIGDVRGISQDKINFKNILDTLSHLEELHGVCILLKPNNARVNVVFRFCIKELLTHLHRDASKNIVFCFTNSRGTFYRPGDTMPALKSLLAENQQVEIALSKHTVYCYDSEAYRFLAAIKNKRPVVFPDDEKDNFSKSWEKSIKETMRMMEHIRSLKPHPIKSTLNLNHAREMVLKLTRPLAEISRNIQTNKAIVEDERKTIENTAESIDKLKKNLMTTRTEIEVTKIDYPKTVCSNGKCVKVWKIDENVSTTEYVQVCHDHCGLGSSVQQDSIGDPALMGCAAMVNGNCRHSTCGHSYREHLHVYYESKQVAKQVEDQTVRESLNKNLSAKEMKEKMIAGKNQLIKEYENELKTIQVASVRFAYFLKTNAITPYNDGMEQYYDHLITDEQHKIHAGGNRTTLEALKLSKASYLEERKILEEAMKEGSKAKEALGPQEIQKIVTELKALKHSGEKLTEALECVQRTAHILHQTSAFVPVQVKRSKNKRAAPMKEDQGGKGGILAWAKGKYDKMRGY